MKFATEVLLLVLMLGALLFFSHTDLGRSFLKDVGHEKERDYNSRPEWMK